MPKELSKCADCGQVFDRKLVRKAVYVYICKPCVELRNKEYKQLMNQTGDW